MPANEPLKKNLDKTGMLTTSFNQHIWYGVTDTPCTFVTEYYVIYAYINFQYFSEIVNHRLDWIGLDDLSAHSTNKNLNF